MGFGSDFLYIGYAQGNISYQLSGTHKKAKKSGVRSGHPALQKRQRQYQLSLLLRQCERLPNIEN